MRRLLLLAAACGLTLLSAGPAQAQLNGSHTMGDFGVQSGSQPAPGFYAAAFYLHYGTDTIKNADGDTVRLAQDSPSSLGVGAVAPLLWYVSKTKILGANYGAFVTLPFANASLEAPAFQLSRPGDTGVSDLLFRPLDLGWHTPHADVAAGLQLYLPTGRYTPGGDDNLGKGMWTYEPFVGATVFFDEKKTFSFATTAYWEFHGKKEDSDVKVGQILSLEGGLGKSFLGGGVIIGAAYYAQWKITKDQLREFVLPGGDEIGLDFPQQAQGVRLRPGRDPADRDQVEALRPGQHPLFLGNGRPGEDEGRDTGRDRDLPDSQREAEVTKPRGRTSQSKEKAMKLMRTPFAIVVLLCALAKMSVHAQTPALDRTMLPIPEPDYPHSTVLDARDTKPPPRFEVKAPAGAPNVLIVLVDDMGFGMPSAFGGPVRMPTADAPRQPGPALQPVPHHGALLADADGAALRPQPPHEQHGRHHRDRHGLSRQHRAAAGQRRAARGDAAAERLQHGLLRQEPRDGGVGGQPLRADQPLADALGLRQVLRLHRRRDRPVGAQPLRRPDPRRDAALPGLQLHDRHDRPGDRLDEVPEGAHAGQAVLHVLRAGRDARAASRAQGVDRQEQGPVRRRLGQDARRDARAADRAGRRAHGHQARRQARATSRTGTS